MSDAFWENEPCDAENCPPPRPVLLFSSPRPNVSAIGSSRSCLTFADFDRRRGKHVLEIGVETGVDCTRFTQPAHVSRASISPEPVPG